MNFKNKTRDKDSVKNKARRAGLKTMLKAIMLHPKDSNKNELFFTHVLAIVLLLHQPKTKTDRNIHNALYFTIS